MIFAVDRFQDLDWFYDVDRFHDVKRLVVYLRRNAYETIKRTDDKPFADVATQR